MSKKTPERRGASGLLGPKRTDKYLEWRRARDNAIQNPRRLKTVADKAEKR
jgi:hypothetical protein